ncbi:MAG: glycosyltransferase family 4 protein [Actinomycetota bacterium]|nr:glycosyltransferase family 4 protein [Actinomycetota bacterium]
MSVRVLQACPYDWNAPGGVQVHVHALAERLHDRGHEVIVVTPAAGPVSEGYVRVAGRPLRVPYQGTVAPVCLSVSSIRRIGAALRSFRPDLVHAHEPIAPSSAMIATLRARVPTVATFHSHAERSRLFDAAAPLLRVVTRRLAVRIAVSEASAGFIGARLGGEFRIVPNGVDVEAFARGTPAPDLPPGRRMLWVGRLDPQKGFGIALRAFARLAGELPDLHLVVAGDGRDRGAVDALPPEVRSRVTMLGAVPHAALPAYHAAADVYVAPALGQESFGMVLVEAMAAGVPVVASDIAGYREVVHNGEDGLLVPPGDPAALAGAVRRVLEGPGLSTHLREAGRTRAQAYSWDRVTEQIESIYAEVLGHRAGA